MSVRKRANQIRILIADDHQVVREGLVAFLPFFQFFLNPFISLLDTSPILMPAIFLSNSLPKSAYGAGSFAINVFWHPSVVFNKLDK